MRNWRVVTAVAAVVLAALAGLLVFKYTQDQKDEAKKPFKFVNVLVVQSRVPKQTSFESALETGLISRKDVVRQDVPDTAIPGESPDATLKSTYSGRVASHDLVPGQTVVTSDFVSQGSIQSGLAGTLASDAGKNGLGKNTLAITLSLDQAHAVGGFLSPGDHVNIITTVDIKDETPASRYKVTTNGKNGVKLSAFLIGGVKVLTVGNQTTATQNATTPAVTSNSKSGTTTPTTAASTTTQSSNNGMITVEVTPRQALQIVQAQAVGSLYVTLNPATFKAGDFNDPEEIVEAANLYDFPTPLTDKVIDEVRQLLAQQK